MSFKKNLFTVILATVLVLIGCWLVGIPRPAIINGMTLVLATMVMTLLIEDFWRKALTAKELLTWQYFIGAALISASVLAWLWASESVTNEEMVIRLVATFLSGGLGGIWMAIPYTNSVRPREDRDAEKVLKIRDKQSRAWERWVKKIEKAKPEDRKRYLGAHLRFHLVGDTSGGALDFTRPLAVVDEKALTLDEMVKAEIDPSLVAQVDAYLQMIAGKE